jgi:hypothetical protein
MFSNEHIEMSAAFEIGLAIKAKMGKELIDTITRPT